MKSNNTKAMYREALEIALDAFNGFYDQHERVSDRHEKGLGNTDLTRLMERDEAKLAAASDAQCRLICELFGVSDEQVQAHLMEMRVTRRAA